MARHSHWHNIQLTKGKADAKKAQTFSKFAKAITVAAKDGGTDPNFNFKLRMAVDAAKAVSMPKDNIDRAIERATGGDGCDQLKEVVYEGYGPGGIALIVTCVTDNSTRTVAEVKNTLSRHGGNMGASGSVMWMFDKKGMITIPTKEIKDRDAVELAVIDGGAQDLRTVNDRLEVVCEVKDLAAVVKVVEGLGIKPDRSGIEYLAKDPLAADASVRDALDTLIEALEENNDVEAVYTNEF